MTKDTTEWAETTEQDLVDFAQELKATEGHLEPDPEPGELSGAHADYLASQAVDLELARALGVRTLAGRDDTAGLGEPWDSWANFPAILFPWTGPDGRTEYQVRPDNPTEDRSGRPRKYVFRPGMVSVLWVVRDVPTAERVLIVEGTKQCLAAASYALPGVAVFGIAGCRGWQHDGVPIPDLAVADGRDVVVILDADAASNAEVYSAGEGLAQALAMEGATSVTFARLPASGKSGLDDVLATRPAERRAAYLDRLVTAAKPRPADVKPKPKKRSQTAPGDDKRATLVCNRDRLAVINDLTTALIEKWDGRELFNYGGVISRLDGATMQPIDRGASRDLIQETAITVNENETAQGTQYDYTWPDFNTISATLSRASKFSPLERVARSPFVRPDGTICTEPGYDEATRTVLVPDEPMTDLEVPESPSPEEVAAARELILTEWLGDFPFEGEPDRANALAMVVTPAIRGLVGRVPLAVVDGLQMGVGKNLLADSILTVYTGEPARPMNFVDEREELRKQITSAFRTGAEFFVFDEAHTIDGAALAQALTATTWQDRILGFSTMAEFPNRVTWLALGNQVQVRGDLTRRVYRVALRPTYDNPQDRPAHTFRHPGQSGLDLGSWTRAHRRDLLAAILTLVRAWFAAGQPHPERGISFGSFEAWERIVGGIVQVAGLSGFLGNLSTWRSESDFDSQYWVQHLAWLYEQFGSELFRAGEVRSKALADPGGYLAPPRLDDPAEKGYAKALGEAYARLRGRRYEGYRIEHAGHGQRKVSKWTVIKDEGGHDPKPTDDTPTPEGRDPEGPGGTATPYTFGKNRAVKSWGTGESERESVNPGSAVAAVPPGPSRSLPEDDTRTEGADMNDTDNQVEITLPAPLTSELVTFDLETGDATRKHHHGPGYVRLAGWAHDDQDPQIQAHGAGEVAEAVRHGATVTGHNIMAFDLPVLVREGQMTMTEIHAMAAAGRLFDGMLAARYLDPPMARDKGVDATRRYGLDALGMKFELGRKTGNLKALAKAHGGWDQIPTENPEYREYLNGDVELSRALFRRLLADLGGTVPDYLVREHRVAALAAQISYNGFRVDVDELERRVRQGENRKRAALQRLHDRYGVPLTDAKGKPYASPLATKAGKRALTDALVSYGATAYWTTDSSGELATSYEAMKHLAAQYHHVPEVVDIAKAVATVVKTRTVYETISHNLVGGRVHPEISMHQATGRWSLTEPGLTVMGKRGGRHVEREVFLPEPGEVILAVDLSQVDMRAVAGLSQDRAYISMLGSEDPHAEIARELFGTVERREAAKAIGHGWNYGRGIRAISEMEEIDPGLVRQFDASMRERFPRLVQWQGEVRAQAESGELLDNGFGRPMRPDPQRAHTQGPALMGQGAARDIMMEGLLRLPAEVLPMLRAQVHDEIVLSVPEDQAVEVERAVVEALSFEWRGVPIVAGASPVGKTWGHVYAK